jgi:hypothetical protein
VLCSLFGIRSSGQLATISCFVQAWQGLYATVLAGEQVENPSAWLVLVTFRRAIDESRAASRTGVVGMGDMAACPSRLDARAPDLAGELDDRTRLRHVFEAMRATLSPRECEAASLCYLQGLSRAEAATQLGISEARMRKLMEGAGPARPGVAGKVGELLDTVRGGGWCEQQSSLMRAYAFGILDPDGERYALAVAHTRECPACRAHVASLRGLASVLPPLPLLSRLVLAGGAGTTAGAGSGAGVGAGTTGVGSGAGATAGAVASGAGAGTATGWGGVMGSLTVKLAVTALVVFGAGYAVLGSRAHGSPSVRHPVVVSRSVVSSVRPGASLSARDTTSSHRARPATYRSTKSHRGARHDVHSEGEAAAREFGPERVGSSSASPAPAAASPPAQPSAAGEFGFE